MEEEILVLKDENGKLNHEKNNMVLNLKNALQNGFDILNSSDTVERHSQSSSSNFGKMKTPEPMVSAGNFMKGIEHYSEANFLDRSRGATPIQNSSNLSRSSRTVKNADSSEDAESRPSNNLPSKTQSRSRI